jgi:hypothetical protein
VGNTNKFEKNEILTADFDYQTTRVRLVYDQCKLSDSARPELDWQLTPAGLAATSRFY